MANEKDKTFVVLYNFDYNKTYIENYERSMINCRETSEEHAQGIDCEIANIKREIRQMKREDEIAKGVVYREGVLEENCIDPLANDERIKFLEGYIDFLQEKKNGIVKSARELFRNEKYYLLELLGFFKLPEWEKIILRRDRESILAQLLGCDIDYAKDLINGRNKVKESNKDRLVEMIKEMQKGV